MFADHIVTILYVSPVHICICVPNRTGAEVTIFNSIYWLVSRSNYLQVGIFLSQNGKNTFLTTIVSLFNSVDGDKDETYLLHLQFTFITLS